MSAANTGSSPPQHTAIYVTPKHLFLALNFYAKKWIGFRSTQLSFILSCSLSIFSILFCSLSLLYCKFMAFSIEAVFNLRIHIPVSKRKSSLQKASCCEVFSIPHRLILMDCAGIKWVGKKSCRFKHEPRLLVVVCKKYQLCLRLLC